MGRGVCDALSRYYSNCDAVLVSLTHPIQPFVHRSCAVWAGAGQLSDLFARSLTLETPQAPPQVSAAELAAARRREAEAALRKQEELLAKPWLLEKLPDKGDKVRDRVAALRRELAELGGGTCPEASERGGGARPEAGPAAASPLERCPEEESSPDRSTREPGPASEEPDRPEALPLGAAGNPPEPDASLVNGHHPGTNVDKGLASQPRSTQQTLAAVSVSRREYKLLKKELHKQAAALESLAADDPAVPEVCGASVSVPKKGGKAARYPIERHARHCTQSTHSPSVASIAVAGPRESASKAIPGRQSGPERRGLEHAGV